MKLTVDRGNINGLKVLISASISSKSVELNLVNIAEKTSCSKKLPILELTSDVTIFSSNAAARFLYGKDENLELVDEWVEWEATQLQPLVHQIIAGKYGNFKVDDTTRTQLKTVLDKAEQQLVGKSSFLGDIMVYGISIVDVVIWSSIFPLFNSSSPFKEYKDAYGGLQAWFTTLHSRPAFQDAVKTLFSKIEESLKAYVQNHTVPYSPSVHTQDLYKKRSSSVTAPETSANSESNNEPAVSEVEMSAAVEAFSNGGKKAAKPRQRSHPLLPLKNEKNVLITSALPYVNNVPHLGNIIGCVLSADVFSRFCRLRNQNVLYICGTDEYGTATETKAVEEGLTPKEICDKYNKLHTEIYRWFNIDFDYFGRTTTTQQTEIAQDIFWKLQKNGHILKDNIEQLLCTKCDRFLADRFVEGICPLCGYEDARGDQCDKCGKLINAVELKSPRCKLCQQPPIIKTSGHLFLDLPNLTNSLKEYTDKIFAEGLSTYNVKVITKSWIRDGLKPRCISRDLKWGTQVPLEGYTDKVFYVWYDAPIGYISITANYTSEWKQWWKNPQQVEYYEFMAKDNVPFHSVIFPSTLLGTKENWTLVNHLSATEYLNYEDTKFSKSRGVGVFGNNAQSTGIPADVFRFYLLYVRPEGQDSSFSWDDFVMKNNSELLNNLGNFINRALMFVKNNFDGTIPPMNLSEVESELLALITRELTTFTDNLQKLKLRDGIRNILSISRLGNQYLQSQKPWVLVKGSDTDKAKAGTVLGVAANIACLLSVLVQPYMPEVSKTIQSQLNAPADCNVISEQFISYLRPAHKIGQPKPLFQKIEMSVAVELKKRFAGKQDSPAPENKPGTALGATSADVERLTAEVAKQGDIVRGLKAKKAEKAVVNVEVAKLLDLKKQLADCTAAAAAKSTEGASDTNQPAPAGANPAEVERLTAEVTKQGGVVRELKGQKAEKSQIDSEVTKLLELKRLLCLAEGKDPAVSAVGTSGKKKKNKKK